MIRKITVPFLILICLTIAAFSQIPTATHIAILKAEDARRYDRSLEDLMKSPNEQVRNRAALAAGRIGNDAAIPALSSMLEKGSVKEREMAAFALGEVESIKGSDAILRELGIGSSLGGSARPKLSESSRLLMRVARNGNGGAETRPVGSAPAITARVLEAAGKIAAANANDPRSKELGAAILKILVDQESTRTEPNTDIIRLGLTAVLRSRPAGSEETVRKFLAFTDPNVVADALNTLARLRAKNANRDARDLLSSHLHAIVRANAARVLGAAEDKEAVDVLIKAATADSDSRVRVAAIRSLAALKDTKAADPLLKRGEVLFDAYQKAKKPNFIPNENSEFLEIATALGRVLPNTRNERAVNLFREFGKLDKGHSPEVYVARIRIAPGRGDNSNPELNHWSQYSTLAQVVGEFSALEPTDDEGKKMKAEAPRILRSLAEAMAKADPVADAKTIMAGPDVLRAYARFKTNDLGDILRTALVNRDVQIRAAAAELISELPPTQEILEDLVLSFDYAFRSDTTSNDASVATLEALFKLDKTKALSRIAVAIDMLDQVVRMRARQMLDDEAYKGVERANELLRYFNENRRDRVSRFTRKGTMPGKVEISRLGLLWNTELDYRRAATRKNGTVKAMLTTEKGTFTIDLLPEDAPLTSIIS
jgi:HEAT repeat protein